MSVEKVFQGIGIFGDCIGLHNPTIATFALTGRYDDQLLCSFYYTSTGKIPTGDEYKTSAEAKQMLEGVKQHIRDCISGVFRAAEREEMMAKQRQMETVRAELQQSNKPHHLGTVAEIAARYNISKSVVRRRKADGSLDNFLETLHKAAK